MEYWYVTLLGVLLAMFGLMPLGLRSCCGVLNDTRIQKGYSRL